MYLHLFMLLFSSGASGYFLPLKETLHLQNKTKYAIIDEMLCLLGAVKESINGQFSTPLHVKNQSCAHNNTKTFINELRTISSCSCMGRVEKDMEMLEKNCTILKKSSSKDKRCSQSKKTNFTLFKKSLEEFLKWVNQKQYCSNMSKHMQFSSMLKRPRTIKHLQIKTVMEMGWCRSQFSVCIFLHPMQDELFGNNHIAVIYETWN